MDTTILPQQQRARQAEVLNVTLQHIRAAESWLNETDIMDEAGEDLAGTLTLTLRYAAKVAGSLAAHIDSPDSTDTARDVLNAAVIAAARQVAGLERDNPALYALNGTVDALDAYDHPETGDE